MNWLESIQSNEITSVTVRCILISVWSDRQYFIFDWFEAIHFNNRTIYRKYFAIRGRKWDAAKHWMAQYLCHYLRSLFLLIHLLCACKSQRFLIVQDYFLHSLLNSTACLPLPPACYIRKDELVYWSIFHCHCVVPIRRSLRNALDRRTNAGRNG